MLPTNASNRTRYRKSIIPGWNEHCKHKRETAIHWHNIWKNEGRPRMSYTADMRRRSRAQYHRIVRKVNRNEQSLRSEKMAQCIIENDTRNFWIESRKMRGKNSKPPYSVDNITGDVEISELFADKFKTVFNSVGYDKGHLYRLQNVIHNRVNLLDIHECNSALMDGNELSDIINLIKHGKSDGNIGLFSDHIIHGTELLYTYLAELFNCMIIHGVSPSDMMVGTMIPIPKGKRVNASNSDNFRGICLQSVMCKIIDIFVLCRESKTLNTSNLQFGFKKKLSTAMATAVVCETVDYYLNKGGIVYGLSLDASKAFDRVEFCTLFQKLVNGKCNILYVRLIFNMYVNQQIRVRFNNHLSNYFKVSNGVKQGGVLSPTLFTFYINDLLKFLEKSGLGCKVGNVYAGVVSYADDLLILSPTIKGLKSMIKICEEYAFQHSILFNGKKCNLIVFDKSANMYSPIICVDNEKVPVVDNIKYLGHVIKCDRKDAGVGSVKCDYVKKINSCLADFSHISSAVTQELVNKYCSSFYGSNLCKLSDRDMELLFIEWRKCVRRVWKLPSRAHSNLLPHISCTLPPDLLLHQRFVKFVYSCFQSSNIVVSNMFHVALCNPSCIGNNLRYIFHKYGLNFRYVKQYSSTDICNIMFNRWLSGVKNEDIRIGFQLRELAIARDSPQHWIFHTKDTQYIIDFLSTM
jgi:hypothetical protein